VHDKRWPSESGIAGEGSDKDRQELVDEVAAQVIQQLRARAPDFVSEPSADRDLVFVACSLDPDMDPVYDAVERAADAVGLRAARVRDFQSDCCVTDKMLALVRTASLVVADLSHDRPNVYFELGYARGLGKTVITIRRAGASPHLDVRELPYLEYMDSRPLEHQLRKRLRFEVD